MKRLLVFAALLVALPSFAADDKPKTGVPVAGIGIVSTSESHVFLPAKGGGVEAVKLTDGTQVWANKDAAKLAGASDTVLYAWVGDEKKPNTFRIVAIDVNTGKTSGKSDPIEMPDWATTAKVGGRTFRVAAKADGENVLVVWQAGAFYFGGAAPTEEIIAAAKKDASAVVAVNFKTGKVTAVNRKPKEDDYTSSPSGSFLTKAAGYEFQVNEELPGLKPGSMTKVTLSVLKNNKKLWSRELAGNPWSPPPP